MKFLLGPIVVILAAIWSPPSWATTEAGGIKFEDQIQLGHHTLQLQGAGIRTKFFLNIYAAGLYLENKPTTAQTLLNQPGAKSIQLTLLRDLSSAEFAHALTNGFKANNTEADITKFEPKLAELEKLMHAFPQAKKGYQVQINWLPETGTRVLFNGQPKGPDLPGEDFYQALMKIWLGPQPVDAELKRTWLGKKK